MTAAEREELILKHTALAHMVVRRFAGITDAHEHYEDLVQEVMIGILNAIETHDPALGDFVTHATWKARGRLTAALEVFNRRGFVLVGRRRRVPPLARAGHPDDGVDVPEAQRPEAWTEDEWREVLACLDQRDRLVIVRRYRHGQAQTDVAAELGITRTRVQQIERRALAALRRRHGYLEEAG